MFGKLFLLFVFVPLLELALLIRVGSAIGLWPTMGIVVATGAIGALLAKSQGLRVLREIRADLSQGRMPAGSLIDGLLVLGGATLLLTPGVITDAVGLLLLLPITRGRLKRVVRGRIERGLVTGRIQTFTLIR